MQHLNHGRLRHACGSRRHCLCPASDKSSGTSVYKRINVYVVPKAFRTTIWMNFDLLYLFDIWSLIFAGPSGLTLPIAFIVYRSCELHKSHVWFPSDIAVIESNHLNLLRQIKSSTENVKSIEDRLLTTCLNNHDCSQFGRGDWLGISISQIDKATRKKKQKEHVNF